VEFDRYHNHVHAQGNVTNDHCPRTRQTHHERRSEYIVQNGANGV